MINNKNNKKTGNFDNGAADGLAQSRFRWPSARFSTFGGSCYALFYAQRDDAVSMA